MGKAPHGESHRYRQLWGPGKGVTGRGEIEWRGPDRGQWAHWGGVWLPGSQGESRRREAGPGRGGLAAAVVGGGLPLGSRRSFLPVASVLSPWGPGTLHPRPGRDTHVFVCAELGLSHAVPWAQTHRDIPTVPTLTPHLDLSMSHPSEPVSFWSEGREAPLCAALGEATRGFGKSTDSSPEGIPGQRTSWPGC